MSSYKFYDFATTHTLHITTHKTQKKLNRLVRRDSAKKFVFTPLCDGEIMKKGDIRRLHYCFIKSKILPFL